MLARRNYGEADRIVVLYSKDYGKVSVIAKGVRRTKSKKSSSVEVFSRIKFSAARGKNLDILTETEILDSYAATRKDLKKVSVAYFLMETVGRLTREDEPNIKYYSDVLENLRTLASSKSLRKLREQFVYDSLVELGFWPKGKKMENVDKVLEEVSERQSNSARVGKKMLA